MTDLVGLLAGLFVILAFHARSPFWLRGFAVTSNLLFIAYALLIELLPIFLLHGILLLLNLVRLSEFLPARHIENQMSDEERAEFVQYARIGRDTCAFRYV